MASKNGKLAGRPRWALVTGASAGIGREFCRQLAERGYQLVLVARRTERLEALAGELEDAHGVHCLVITADLSIADAGARITASLEEAGIAVDFLVNNAGYGLPGSFHVSTWQAHAAYIQLMVTCVCELTWRLLPGMQARGHGRIINVASVAGLAPASAGHTLYGASKAFLIKFSESLALENVDKGVRVSALCPGFTYSEFHDVNGTRAMISKLPAYMWQQAEDVVRCALENMAGKNPKPVLVPGGYYKFILFMYRHLPWLVNKLMARNARHYRITE
ncbi:MAG: SDR family oxidoreductase [Lysobacterales bacterium]|jgi:short-subunit dehydrogenase